MKKVYQDIIGDLMKMPMGEKPKMPGAAHGQVHITIASGHPAGADPMDADPADPMEEATPEETELDPSMSHNREMAAIHAKGRGRM